MMPTLFHDDAINAQAPEIRAALTSGLAPAEIARARGLSPSDLITAVVAPVLRADHSDGPTLVQSPCTAPDLVRALDLPALAALFPHAPRTAVLALAAGVYQALDAWDASHSAAQEADDLGEHFVSHYWHGIAHRREPDPGNAAYWFRRVGRHGNFRELAEAAYGLDPQRADAILRKDAWHPQSFIEFCTHARPGTPDETFARRVQRAEMDLLLHATLTALD